MAIVPLTSVLGRRRGARGLPTRRAIVAAALYRADGAGACFLVHTVLACARARGIALA
jgi:hypothetical protein